MQKFWKEYLDDAMAKGQVSRDLYQLHPGEDVTQILTLYYRKKKKTAFLIAAVGLGMSLLVYIKGSMDSSFSEMGSIERSSRREGEALSLTAIVGEAKIDGLTVQIAERNLTKAEAAALYEEFASALLQEVLGENTSFTQVCYPLELSESITGYPFTVEWTSSDYRYCREDGSITYETGFENQTLTARILYRDFEETLLLPVTLCPVPKSEEEQLRQELQQLLTDKEATSRDDESFWLPMIYEGEAIIWQEEKENTAALLAVLTIITAALVYMFSDQDLHKQNVKRREQLRKEYPFLLMKLTLYMEAGLTLRGSFTKVAENYRRNNKREHPICKELTIACNELSSGMAEGAVYEQLGRRLDMQEYMRMSMLLSQNLRKGSSELRKRLGQEAQNAVTDNLQYHKKKGEEAQTKLLFPMMGLLLMVMMLVMIPAFYGVTM